MKDLTIAIFVDAIVTLTLKIKVLDEVLVPYWQMKGIAQGKIDTVCAILIGVSLLVVGGIVYLICWLLKKFSDGKQ